MDENRDLLHGALKTGDLAKEFSLLDQDGSWQALLPDKIEEPLALVFYRGDW